MKKYKPIRIVPKSQEEWKFIPGYEGLYMASRNGRIKSIDRIITRHKHGEYLRGGNIMKFYADKDGYYHVKLSKNGIAKDHMVSRLVAFTFIKNEFGKSEINHIDGCKTNNHVENLEWCTRSENQKHAFDTGLQRPTMVGMSGINSPVSKPIIQFINSKDIIEYINIEEAHLKTGISSAHISEVCNKKIHRYTAGGFKWMFKKDYEYVTKKYKNN